MILIPLLHIPTTHFTYLRHRSLLIIQSWVIVWFVRKTRATDKNGHCLQFTNSDGKMFLQALQWVIFPNGNFPLIWWHFQGHENIPKGSYITGFQEYFQCPIESWFEDRTQWENIFCKKENNRWMAQAMTIYNHKDEHWRCG